MIEVEGQKKAGHVEPFGEELAKFWGPLKNELGAHKLASKALGISKGNPATLWLIFSGYCYFFFKYFY